MISNTTYKLLAAAMILTLLVVGCQKEDKVSIKHTKSGVLSFNVNEDKNWSDLNTKSGGSYRSEMHLMECDTPDAAIGDVYIYMIEENISDQIVSESELLTHSVQTKAESQTQSPVYGVFAYQGSGNAPSSYIPTGDVSKFKEVDNLGLYSDGTYVGQKDGLEIYAPGMDKWLQFFIYGPYTSEVNPTGTLNPVLKENGKFPYYEYTATPSLVKTTDLLFGGSSPINGDLNTTDAGETPPVELRLSHILSRIKVNATFAYETVVTSVKIIDVKNKGTYTYSEVDGTWAYRWGLTSDKETYTVYENTAYNNEINNSLINTVQAETINVLPQTISTDAKLQIVVEAVSQDPKVENGTRSQTYVLTKNLSAISEQWHPNKQYTYNIITPQEVQVQVTDELTRNDDGQPVKKNLSILNNGLSPAYIRASINGNWVLPNNTDDYADDPIVAAWNPTTEGTYVWGAHNNNQEPSTNATTGWRKHSDGYYYHLNPVQPGETTAKLFDSYTLTVKAPVANAVLDMAIVVQAVYPTDVTILWPKDITDLFVQTSFVSE